jgi:hypothetical protein
MKRFKVTYKDVEHGVSAGLRAAFIFEKIAEKPLELKTTFDITLYAYSILWTSDAFTETWDDFVEYCDENRDFATGLFKKIPVPGNANAPTT